MSADAPDPQDDLERWHPLARRFRVLLSVPVKRRALTVLGGLSLALVALDLLHPRHDHVKAAETAGFYAAYGFAAFVFVVLCGWPLGRLLRRPERYYGERDDDV
ncbi:MAG: hypothetical protein ACFB2Z_02845 [Maricaulaceae bacterium]